MATRPMFGIICHLERRESNRTVTSSTASTITETSTQYLIWVTRFIVLWITVWVHETDYYRERDDDL